MKDVNFNENDLNIDALGDIETARSALRWALDKIRRMSDELLRVKQDLHDKNSQINFLEKQVESKNLEIARIIKANEEEIEARRKSLEMEFKSKLERISERERELEEKVTKYEEIYRTKEQKLLE
ncbi:MAG: hypothetical protein ACP5SD_03970, partial [Elusimicrobiales bacterium]